MILCAELSGTHGGHTGKARYNVIAAALLLPSKGLQASFFKVFTFSLLLNVRKEVPVEKQNKTTNRCKRGKSLTTEAINSQNL